MIYVGLQNLTQKALLLRFLYAGNNGEKSLNLLQIAKVYLTLKQAQVLEMSGLTNGSRDEPYFWFFS